ncbi:unnamed protein product, partial [Rotaria sordida]
SSSDTNEDMKQKYGIVKLIVRRMSFSIDSSDRDKSKSIDITP